MRGCTAGFTAVASRGYFYGLFQCVFAGIANHDVKSVVGNISEMRIFVNKGYRLYFTVRGEQLVILLCGEDKSNQSRDIEKAREILQELEE